MPTSHKTRSVSLGKPEAGRFWGKVRRAGKTDCWLWSGSKMTRGYGQIWYDGGPKGTHRVAWELSHGPIPEGQSILHTCDVRLCCNPSHLFIGTHTDNMQDAAKKGRLHVPRPGRQKITDDQVEQAVAMVRSGMTQVAVAKAFGVTKAAICRIMAGTLRQHRQPSKLRRSA